ncbi:MAG: hypothetical protein KBS41_02475 [Oscillospiraceae bacterium]|nr:hypothetical protein [Candidatus Equicaccousia limihippi]
MIDKQTFINSITTYTDQCELDMEVSQSLENICGGTVLLNSENRLYDVYINLLEEMFDDRCEMIVRFVEGDLPFTAPNGSTVDDAASLYDALISCMSKNE